MKRQIISINLDMVPYLRKDAMRLANLSEYKVKIAGYQIYGLKGNITKLINTLIENSQNDPYMKAQIDYLRNLVK